MRKAPAILLMAAALALAGCGYRPLYGTAPGGGGVAASLSGIAIPEPQDRVGQLIRNDLMSSMQTGAAEEKYSLVLKPVVKKTGIVSKVPPDTSRQAIVISVEYELVERASGATVTSGHTFSQASFDVIRQPFADMQAETDAAERAAQEVSADIRTRLATYFAARHKAS